MKNTFLPLLIIIVVGVLVITSPVFNQGGEELGSTVASFGAPHRSLSPLERQFNTILRFFGIERGGIMEQSLVPTEGERTDTTIVNMQPLLGEKGALGGSSYLPVSSYWDKNCKYKVKLDGYGFTFSKPDANGNGTAIADSWYVPNGTYHLNTPTPPQVLNIDVTVSGSTSNLTVNNDGTATATSGGVTYTGTVTGSGTAADPYTATMTSADGSKTFTASWYSQC